MFGYAASVAAGGMGLTMTSMSSYLKAYLTPPLREFTSCMQDHVYAICSDRIRIGRLSAVFWLHSHLFSIIRWEVHELEEDV